MNRIFFITFVYLLLIPSHRIGQVQLLPSPLDIPAMVSPGSFFIWPRHGLMASPVVGGLRATYVADRDQFLAAIGLNQRGPVDISGYLKSKHSLFQHPVVFWYHHTVSILEPPSKRVTQLQIPKAVWNKLVNSKIDRQQKEKRIMRQLTYRSDEPLDVQCFQNPLNRMKVVSKFASPRRLPNGKEYLHTGVDLRARQGTDAMAVAAGTIELADSMLVSGQTVLVDHGGGLHSTYFHLDEILKEEGDIVEAGDVVGKVGSTGRAEAPHLHWEMVWKGRFVDPLRFLQAWGQTCDQE